MGGGSSTGCIDNVFPELLRVEVGSELAYIYEVDRYRGCFRLSEVNVDSGEDMREFNGRYFSGMVPSYESVVTDLNRDREAGR